MSLLKNKDEYIQYFPENKRKKALEQAWKNRDFEIQMYWRRATYFWAFIVSIFGAYLLINTSEKFADENVLNIGLLLLGLIFSVCWVAVNIGSKKWQENWEYHIDLLEDDITGPIYKTALIRNAPSVSQVNLLASYLISIAWLLFLVYNINKVCKGCIFTLNAFCICISILLLIVSLGFLFGFHKKFRKKKGGYQFELRPINYKKN